jgi:hypothetical protein
MAPFGAESLRATLLRRVSKSGYFQESLYVVLASGGYREIRGTDAGLLPNKRSTQAAFGTG